MVTTNKIKALKEICTSFDTKMYDMTNLMSLPYLSYKGNKAILHDRAIVMEENESMEFQKCETSFPAQVPSWKHSFKEIALYENGFFNFGHVYLAKKKLNGLEEIIYSALLFVNFKTKLEGKNKYYGFEIPDTVDLTEQFRKYHANALVWLPEIQLA